MKERSSIPGGIGTISPSLLCSCLLLLDPDTSVFLAQFYSLSSIYPSLNSCYNVAKLSIYFSIHSILSFIVHFLALCVISLKVAFSSIPGLSLLVLSSLLFILNSPFYALISFLIPQMYCFFNEMAFCIVFTNDAKMLMPKSNRVGL